MPYQSHPASLVDLLDKLMMGTDKQTDRRTDWGDDNNPLAEKADG